MSDDSLRPGKLLDGPLFRGFLKRLAEIREPEPGDRIGAWRIVRELGRGGSGVVFLAERADGAFNKNVALKWLRGDRPTPGGREALARERELLSSLDHPHIARLIDGGQTDDGMLWFAMDYASGQTIDRHAETLGLRERLGLVMNLCQAVQHAHRRGLIHGDIKPSNVLIDGRGQPRLLDFGISRLTGGAIGSSYGLTPDYASPEQRQGGPLTTASDIWQLGRLLEDLLSDHPVSADLRAIIDCATATSPEQRYASPTALASDLQAWLEQLPVRVYPGGLGYRFRRWVQRNTAVALVSTLALLTLSGAGVWMAWQVMAERDLARTEAARAEAALAESESALARATALRDFLLDLFRATRPTQPRDELPTTAEILERGAQRALDSESAPAKERFGMLVALGQVYQSQNLYDQVRPLVEAALQLMSETTGLDPVDQARAMQLKARLMIADGDSLDDAEALLIAAESRLGGAEEGYDLLAQNRIQRTWIERHRGNHAQALSLVEPLYEDLYQPGHLSDLTGGALLDALSGLNAASGNLDQAAHLRTQAIEAYRLAVGETGQGHVVALANSIGLELALGRFDEAERRARRAIELYDQIYPDPVDYRAVARRSLAHILINTGRTKEAFEALRYASDEHAEALGSSLEQWPLYYSQRGAFNARLDRTEAAVDDLARAHALALEQDDWDPRVIASLDMLYAWTRCLADDGPGGQQLLEAMQHSDTLKGHPRNRAQLHEARATCHQANQRPQQALEEIKLALEIHDQAGQVLDSLSRRLLKAEILLDLQRPDETRRVLHEADQRFVALGLDDHPRRTAIQAALGNLPE